jgi:hypothetical protein
MRIQTMTAVAAGAALLLFVPPHCAAQFERLDRPTEKKNETLTNDSKNDQPDQKAEKLTVQQILERMPRRVKSKAGSEGDLVNFVFLGSQEQMTAALTAASWVQADKDTQDAVLHAILSTIDNKGYTEMPMSQLYLFGRPQDFGFAHAMPIQVAQERHHFRVWKTTWQTPDGQAVWLGAGTHDIGIEKGSDGKLTHKIDPEVDKERDYIAQSLQEVEKVKEKSYFSPKQPITKASTATGGSFHSDGRILVIALK